ncbi:hypothetical protein ACFYOG_16825 [Streptomyces sp. NPDC007818]|uniref:hypothetical protein n=1 Tax=Streptomyces sp. NPDC007818 TaxID=3364780 RepID=UPI0036ABD38B
MSTRRHTLWNQTWGAAAALLGLAALTVATLGLAAVPGAATDERQYLQAETCADATPAPHASCLHARKARVATVVIRDEPKQEEFTLRLHKTPGLPQEIDMGGEGPLLERLEAGDDVTVTLWRDYAVVVARDGIAQETADTPEDEAESILAVALALIPLGTFLLHTGASACARARAWADTGLPAVLLLRLKWALGSTLCVLPAVALADLADLGPVGEALVWCAMVPLVRHYLVWKAVRGQGRHARPLATESPVR